MHHVTLNESANMAISADEHAFFVELGSRIAKLRKAQGITQNQLAKTLGVSQQTINSYEVARRRVPASSLPILATLLMTSVDELLGTTTKKINGKRGPTPKLQQQMERVSLLPRTKQQFVMDMLDTVIQQAAH